MNLGDDSKRAPERALEQDLDALLGRWPAPPPGGDGEQDEEKRWENRADATVRAALEATRYDGLGALLADPILAPEPGESGATFRSGGKKMTQEKEPGDSTAAPASQTSPPPPTERRRGSLKEIATRASQSAGRLSQPGTPLPTSTPLPASTSTPIPMAVGRPSRPPMPTPIPGSVPPRALPRPTEAGKDDSGVVNLDAVRAAATSAQVAAAEKAKPGQVGLFDDDQTVESAVNLAEQPAPARPTSIAVVAARRNRTGPVVGATIAVLGIAAAFAIMLRKPPAVPPQPTPVIAAHTAAPEAVKAAPSAAPQAKDTAAPLDVASLPSADPENKQPDPAKVAAAGTGTAGAATATKDAPPDPRLAAKASPTGKPGDLQSEIARAAGGPLDKSAEAVATAEPAAGTRNQSIPEQPSQGSVQAAIGSVVGGAKACVAGADDISRAMVTFSSTGTVSSVSVSGWAAAHGKSGCIEAALKGAKVGPFSKSSYSVPVPIRP